MDKNYQVAVSVDEFANTLELIAAARNALPLLLQIVKVQEEALKAREALFAVEKLVKEGRE